MKSSLLLVALFFIALVAGAGLFAYQASIPDIQGLNDQVQTHLDEISTLDTNTNELALRNRINMENNYDAITLSMTQLKTAVDALANSNSNFEATDASLLAIRYSALRQEIEIKSEFIENFKTRFAVLRNSERYAPVVGARLVLVAENNNADEVAELYRDTIITLLRYTTEKDSSQASELSKLISQLQGTEKLMPKEALTDIIEFNRHSITVLKEKGYVDTYLTSALQTNTQKFIAELDQAWKKWTKQYDKPKQLFNYAVLAYVVYILLILAVTLYLLRSLYKNLEHKVADKTAELQLTFDQLNHSEVQLMQAEKMASLGQLVAGIAHEVNTPLGYVSSNINTVRRSLGGMGDLWLSLRQLNNESSAGTIGRKTLVVILRKMILSYRKLNVEETVSEANLLLEDSVQGLDEISQLVTSLKDFSRVDQADSALVDVHEGLKSTIKICNSVVGHRKIIQSYSPTLPQIRFTPAQLNQVFLNILTNAAHATSPETGEIHIKTDVRGNQVIIEFSDNGCGMDENTQSKIFDPFFTTKGVNEGTGLGMSIVYKLVKSHGGQITVKSELDKGTVVSIAMPIALEQ